MDVAHTGLVHRDPCECKVKGFRAVSSIERNVSKRRHLQGVRQICRSICRILDLMFNLVLRGSAQLLPLSKRMPTKIERFRGFETLHGRQMLGVVSIDYT